MHMSANASVILRYMRDAFLLGEPETCPEQVGVLSSKSQTSARGYVRAERVKRPETWLL